MTSDAPPELSQPSLPGEKRVWIWALLIASAYGVTQFFQAEQGRGPGYREGYAFAAALIPLLGAWIATLFSKKPQMPTIITGTIVVLMLFSNSAAAATIDRATERYAEQQAALLSELQQQDVELGADACAPENIASRAELQKNMALALAAHETCSRLLNEVLNGTTFLADLETAGVNDLDAYDAWQHIRSVEGEQFILQMQATDTLMQTMANYLLELDQSFDHWQVDEHKQIAYAASMPANALQRITKAGDEIQQLLAQLEELRQQPN